MSERRWCIRDRDDVWCAVADGTKPEEDAGSVATLCRDYIIFPHGTEKRRPTCAKCRQALEAKPCR